MCINFTSRHVDIVNIWDPNIDTQWCQFWIIADLIEYRVRSRPYHTI